VNNDIRKSDLGLNVKLTERYVDRAHQLRRDFIRASVQQSLAGVGRGFRWSLARIGGVFRPIAANEARARRC